MTFDQPHGLSKRMADILARYSAPLKFARGCVLAECSGERNMGSMRIAVSRVLLICPSLTVCDLQHGQFTRVEDLLAFSSFVQAGHCLDEDARHLQRVKSRIGKIICLPIRLAYVHTRRLRNNWYGGCRT